MKPLSSPSRKILALWLGCWMVAGATGSWAQGDGGSARTSLDARLFDAVYDLDAPAFRGAMRLADDTAYPVFFGGAAAAWAGAWLVRDGDDWSDAYRLTVSEAGTLAAVFALKNLVRRMRPYDRFADVEARRGEAPSWDRYAFPSGHAALAFALATSYSLSHPRWYVIAPGYLWATGVALSRVWLGVHYPGDVLAGAALGVAVAWSVHRLGRKITPGFLESRDGKNPPLRVQVRFLF